MISQQNFRFRRRREPYHYDMSATGGAVGVSYSFEALDEDDAKCQVKCPEDVWRKLESATRDQVIRCTVESEKPKIAPGTEVILVPVGPAKQQAA